MPYDGRMPVQYLHTKLRVRDLEASVRFYEAAFGYTLRSRRPGPHGAEIAFLTLPGSPGEIQLAQYPDPASFEVPDRLMHLAYRVDSLDEALSRALQAGARLQAEPYQLPSGSRVAFATDPDGYALELIQKP